MAVNRGTPRGEIVHLFGVPLTTIGRYIKQRRETGAVDLKTAPGRTSGASSFNKMLKRRANVSVPGNLH